MRILTAVAPTGSKALDFVSFNDYAGAKANGVTVFLRYLVKTGKLNKQLTPAQRDATFDAGIGLICLWERDTYTAMKGSAQGAIDGHEAGLAASAIGYPVGLPIIAAVDFQVTFFTRTAVRGYLEAFKKEVETFGYTLGVYGGSYIIKDCLDISACNHIANAKSWSTDPLWPGWGLPINFVQYYHVDWDYHDSSAVSYDMNTVRLDTEMWYPHDIPDPIPPKPKDDEMFIYAINGYANTWNSSGVHLSPEAFKAMTDAGIPVVHSDYHEEHVTSLLHLSGLTKANLVPTP